MNKYENCDFEHFPHSTHKREGFHVLQAKEDEVSIRILCDVVYRVVDNVELHLHILLPTQDKECEEVFPLIVYIQGSAWKKQSTGKEVAQLSRFAQRGYVIAIVEYRPSDVAAFPAQVIDAKWAIAYMMDHAHMYFVKKDELILWGDSSGGHTALLCAYAQKESLFCEPGLCTYPIQCVIDYYGPCDITRMKDEPSTTSHAHEDTPEGLLLGKRRVTRATAKDTIVTNYISKQCAQPPLLIVHGSKDRLVPFHQSILLFDKMKEEEKEVEAYQIWNGDHGGSCFWNHELLLIVDTFIKKHKK